MGISSIQSSDSLGYDPLTVSSIDALQTSLSDQQQLEDNLQQLIEAQSIQSTYLDPSINLSQQPQQIDALLQTKDDPISHVAHIDANLEASVHLQQPPEMFSEQLATQASHASEKTDVQSAECTEHAENHSLEQLQAYLQTLSPGESLSGQVQQWSDYASVQQGLFSSYMCGTLAG